MKRLSAGLLGAALLLGCLAATPALAGWSLVAGGGAGDLEALWGRSAADVLAVGGGPEGELALHFDGTDWTPTAAAPPPGAGLHGLWGSPGGGLWAVGERLAQWRDGSWSLDPCLPPRPLSAVWGRSATDVYAVGRGGLIMHYDGSAWRQVKGVPTSADLYDIAGEGRRLVAVGAGGTILSLRDGRWHAEQSPSRADLYGVWLGAGGGLAVGEEGTLLRYRGRAQGWEAQPSPTVSDLYDVCGLGTGEAWAVGAAGTILHLRAGAWSVEGGGLTDEDLLGVCAFESGPQLFAVGAAGAILFGGPATGLPAVPGEPVPATGQTGVGMLPRLGWTAETDPPGKELTYTICLDGRTQRLGPLPGGPATWSLPVALALVPETVHDWCVIATDRESGATTVGPWWSFTTAAYPYLDGVYPAAARPWEVVAVRGRNLGEALGDVRVDWNEGEGMMSLRVDEGAIVYWGKEDPNDPANPNDLVELMLPAAAAWGGLPRACQISVRPVGAGEWTNPVALSVSWGGRGGTEL